MEAVTSSLHPDRSFLTMNRKVVVSIFNWTKPTTTSGPDDIYGWTFRHSAEQLGSVFQHLNKQQHQCIKFGNITQLCTSQRKGPIKVLNDLRSSCSHTTSTEGFGKYCERTHNYDSWSTDGPSSICTPSWHVNDRYKDISPLQQSQTSGLP